MTVLLPADSNRIASQVDFKSFYGVGIDPITEAVASQIQRLVEGKDRNFSPSTLRSLVITGAKGLLRYCQHRAEEARQPLALGDLDDEFVRGILLHIKSRDLSVTSQKRTYDFIKTILRCLESQSLLQATLTFPNNPFPHSRRNAKPETPYSNGEARRIARALREDLAPLFEEWCELTPHIAACALLAIALRTGQNLTPLLEMTIDCLRPHFKDELNLLVLTKRRSRREIASSVPQSSADASVVGVLPGTARIIRRIIELTASSRTMGTVGDDLWILAPRGEPTESRLLAAWHVHQAGRRLSEQHELLHDDGRPLRIVVSKMRKTFSNRIFEIAGGSVSTAANAAGHSQAVAIGHYLTPDRGAAKRWSFMGAVLQSELASGTLRMARQLTPSGGCRDTRNGEFAPRNGATCTQFLDCFRCRDYVVTADDLHKVYSLYWLLVRERDTVATGQWEKLYAGIIRVIDRDIAERGVREGIFAANVVARARDTARTAPHPLWAGRAALSLA